MSYLAARNNTLNNLYNTALGSTRNSSDIFNTTLKGQNLTDLRAAMLTAKAARDLADIQVGAKVQTANKQDQIKLLIAKAEADNIRGQVQGQRMAGAISGFGDLALKIREMKDKKDEKERQLKHELRKRNRPPLPPVNPVLETMPPRLDRSAEQAELEQQLKDLEIQDANIGVAPQINGQPSAGTAAITVPGSNDPGVELQSYNPNTYKTGTLLNIGSTGRTTGPHLHFELYDPQGKPVDPASWLAKGLVFTDDGKIFGTSDRMNSPFGNRVIHPVTGERNVMHYGSDYGGEPNQPIYVVGDMTKAYTTDGGGHTAEFSNLSRGRFPQLQGYTGRALHLNTLPMVPGTI